MKAEGMFFAVTQNDQTYLCLHSYASDRGGCYWATDNTHYGCVLVGVVEKGETDENGYQTQFPYVSGRGASEEMTVDGDDNRHWDKGEKDIEQNVTFLLLNSRL